MKTPKDDFLPNRAGDQERRVRGLQQQVELLREKLTDCESALARTKEELRETRATLRYYKSYHANNP